VPTPSATGGNHPGSGRSVPRPTRLAALVIALVAIASAALPVPAFVPLLVLGAITGCFLVDFLVARRRVLTLERTEPETLSLLVPVPFRAAVGGLGEARSVRTRQPVRRHSRCSRRG